jgi:hypothetical protein
VGDNKVQDIWSMGILVKHIVVTHILYSATSIYAQRI